MVQITNALFIAAAVAPSFAAPLEAREPKMSLKRVSKVVENVAEGAELADTVAGIVMLRSNQPQQRRASDDFEEYEISKPFKIKADPGPLKKARNIAENLIPGFRGVATVSPPTTQHPQKRELGACEPGLKSLVDGAVEVGGYVKDGIDFAETLHSAFAPNKSRRSFDDSVELERRLSHNTMRGITDAIAGTAGLAGTLYYHKVHPEQRDLSEITTDNPNSIKSVHQGPRKVAKVVIREDGTRASDPSFLKSSQRDSGKFSKLVIQRDEDRELYFRDYSDKYYLD